MTNIKITNCCADHQCDFCKKCLTGKCCRNDNPNYELPKLGDWDSVIYGELGIFNNDIGGLAECHCCGKLFGHLGKHVWNAHNLTSDEYRAIFGLKQSTGLIGVDLRAKRRNGVAHLEKYQAIATKTLRDFTPEQRMYHKKDKCYRLEEKRDEKFLTQRRSALTLAAVAKKISLEKKVVFYNCAVCGVSFKKRSNQEKSKIHYCSRKCYARCFVRKERVKQFMTKSVNKSTE